MRKTMMIGLALLTWTIRAGESVAYQAVLCNERGQAIRNESTQVKICLYNQVSDGQPLWARESIAVMTDANGLFNVELSDEIGQRVKGVTNTIEQVFTRAAGEGSALYLGLTVKDSSGEIRPRQRMLTLPFASVARDGCRAMGDFTIKGTASVVGDFLSNSSDPVKVRGTAIFNDEVRFTKKATFKKGLAIGTTSSDIGFMPVGTIVIWTGAANTVPTGWAICDGRTVNGHVTPNFTDRFPVGVGDKYALGAEGGEKEVSLTLANMPAHSHSFMGTGVANATGDNRYQKALNGPKPGVGGGYYCFRSYKMKTTGKGAAHNNMPHYYAVYFIMKVK